MLLSLFLRLTTATTQIPGPVTKSHTPPDEQSRHKTFGKRLAAISAQRVRQCGKRLVGVRRSRFSPISLFVDHFSPWTLLSHLYLKGTGAMGHQSHSVIPLLRGHQQAGGH